MPSYEGSISHFGAKIHHLCAKCPDFKSAIEIRLEQNETKIDSLRSKTNAHIDKIGFQDNSALSEKKSSCNVIQ